MELLYIWLALWFLFIIIEMITVSLYWLSMSIASFLVATYVYFMSIKDIDVIQIVIFVTVSTILIFIFPKFFYLSKSDAKIWMDAYIWKKSKLKKVWDDWKIEIEWVDYLVNESCENWDFYQWKSVKIDSYEWTKFNVTLV